MPRVLREHRRPVIAGLIVMIFALAGWHYYTLYSSLRSARDDLLETQQRLTDAGLDLKQTDLVQAQRNLIAARENLDRARSHFRWDPLIQGGKLVPGLETQLNGAQDLLDMAALLIDVGDQATNAGAKAVALRDHPPAGVALTKSLVQLIKDTGPQVERIDQLTKQVVQKRLELGDDALLRPMARMRDRIDKDLPRLANLVEQANQSKELIPAFLGFNGDRNYLVFALNSGELLPGGGLVTAGGILPVSQGVNGRIDFVDSVLWKETAEGLGIPYIPPPAPLQRYLLRDYTWNLLVANWDPDFPTWSQQALQFYELIHGQQQINGIISVDLVVLERLLKVTGPKTLDIEGRGPVTFDSTNAVLLLEELTRPAFEKPQAERKSVIGALAEKVMADLLTLPSERWADAVDVVRRLGAERHVQVLSFDAKEQTILRDAGWDGRLNPTDGDFVEFNEASLLSTKLNLIVKPEGAYHISINELGDVHHELTVKYTNTFPEWAKGKDPKLVADLMYGGLLGAYLRVFGPHGISEYSVEVDGAPGSIDDTGKTNRADWFATWMPVPGGTTRQAVLRWTSTPPGSIANDGYDLYIQKQPGTDGMCLALTIDRNGQAPSRLQIDGGTRDGRGRVCLTTDVRVNARF